MIRKFPKLLILCLALSLAFASGTLANPKEQDLDLASDVEAGNIAKSYLDFVIKVEKTWNEDATIQFDRVLYDYDDIVSGYLFNVLSRNENKGYIITSATKSNLVVLESTREGTNPYSTDNSNLSIYANPLEHVTKDNGKYNNLDTKKSFLKTQIINKGVYTREKLRNKKAIENSNSASGTQSLSTSSMAVTSSYQILTAKDFPWRKGCVPTAYANVIAYWDDFGYPNLITGTLPETGDTLIDELATLMGTTSQGATWINDGILGAKQYFSNHGYTASIGNDINFQDFDNSKAFITIQDEIGALRPLIVGFSKSDPTYGSSDGGHATTGVGWQVNGSNQKYVIVHDTYTYTAKDVYINLASSVLSSLETIKPN